MRRNQPAIEGKSEASTVCLGCQMYKANQEETPCLQLWSGFGTRSTACNGRVPSHGRWLSGKLLSNRNCRAIGAESLLICSGMHSAVRKRYSPTCLYPKEFRDREETEGDRP